MKTDSFALILYVGLVLTWQTPQLMASVPSQNLSSCRDSEYFDKDITETCQLCHHVCENGKTNYPECEQFCQTDTIMNIDNIKTHVINQDPGNNCNNLCTKKFEHTFLKEMKCMDNEICIEQLADMSKEKCKTGEVLEPVLNMCTLCDNACEGKMNPNPVYMKNVCIVACASLYNKPPSRPTTTNRQLVATSKIPSTGTSLFIFAIVFFVVAVVVAFIMVAICLYKNRYDGIMECCSKLVMCLKKKTKNSSGHMGEDEQKRNGDISVAESQQLNKPPTLFEQEVHESNSVSSFDQDNSSGKPPVPFSEKGSSPSDANHNSVETLNERNDCTSYLANTGAPQVSSVRNNYTEIIPLSITKEFKNPLDCSIQEYSEEQFSLKSNIESDCIDRNTDLLIRSQAKPVKVDLPANGIHRPRGMSTMQDVENLPENLSLIENVKEKFEYIVRNDWVKRAICNGKYIRVLYDAIDATNAQNEIKRQTGLGSSHFDVCFAP